MNEKLNAIEEKFKKIETSLSDPAVFSDAAKYAELMKERKSILPVVTKYREYKSFLKQKEDAEEILSSNDPELAELVRSYRRDNRPKLYALMEKYPDRQVLIFRTRAQAQEWLSGL